MDVRPRLCDLDEYRGKARAGEALPEAVLLRKQFIPESVKAAGSRRLTFTVSTGAIDRDRDTIKVDGWRLDNWRKNPVILWAHDSRALPIARGESILTGAGALKATAYFLEPGKDYNPETWPKNQPDPENVYRLLQAGALRATSVGFIPVRGLWNEERGGIDFEEQELLEFSIVPVPSNPEAVVDGKAAEVDLAAVQRWAEQVYVGLKGPGIWFADESAEALELVLEQQRVGKIIDLAAALLKRGRVISQENEARIRRARGGGADAVTALDEVLAQLEAEAAEDDKQPTEPVLKLRPEEPRLPVTADEVRGATLAALEGLVGAQIRHHTGRLD